MTRAEKAAKLYDWNFWARDNQLLPQGNWIHWLILAGRGWGKTRVGAETVRQWIKQGYKYINIIAATESDIEKVMIHGPSGIMSVCPKSERPRYVGGNKKQLIWPNGAVSLVFSAESPDRLRGPQHDKLWCFIGGTQISVSGGSVPIENIKKGDLVKTRFGLRPVIAIGNHDAEVGTVRFSNNIYLTGTGDHPVLTTYGWTRLDKLLIGQFVKTDILSLTSGHQNRVVKQGRFTNIVGFGRKLTGQFQRICKSTIKTITRQIIKLKILNLLATSNIVRFMGLIVGGYVKNYQFVTSNLNVSSVDANWFFLEEKNYQNVSDATGLPLNEKDLLRNNVNIVENCSSQDVENSVVNVVSIWAADGRQTVYNLTVAREHEFIANGIVVHNCDELAAWRYPDAWDQALLGLRLGDNPQAIITTTPRPTKIIKELARDPKTVITRGSSYENAFNLAEAFINKVIRKYENTRIGRQELYAEILEQVQGALWTQDIIDDTRVGEAQLPDLRRVIVAIDPAVTSKENSDETGIVVAGIDGRNPPHAYVLSDKSGRFTPIDWAKTAIHAYYGWRADRVVAEVNNGGEMVENTLRQVDPNVSYTPVIASRGKMIRAEPISSLYEQRRVHHVGVYEELEEQMVTYTYDYDRASNGSPDRMDALVWALTELLVTGSSYDSSMSWVS